ncbi:unnamed protein product [Cuscuta campestris]|uniref:Uncharacterized protein n=1 Tax=Cuscuta campestris TaxID=132261 RepID=A0A484K9Z4_9ASTE|nr:unnamed protein product [Cuscuta campestris]
MTELLNSSLNALCLDILGFCDQDDLHVAKVGFQFELSKRLKYNNNVVFCEPSKLVAHKGWVVQSGECNMNGFGVWIKFRTI